ncbi:hypothetical protein ABR39_00885 [Enterobacter genomosp. O]|nr:hypothetical protein ABR39_00885 [Enterobacter genomosp. O]
MPITHIKHTPFVSAVMRLAQGMPVPAFTELATDADRKSISQTCRDIGLLCERQPVISDNRPGVQFTPANQWLSGISVFE